VFNERSKRVLVIGGMGSLGQPVVRQLIADGMSVRLLTREPFNARMELGGTIITSMETGSADTLEIIEGDCRLAMDVSTALVGCQGLHVSIKVNDGADALSSLESRTALAVAEAVKGRSLDMVTITSCAFVNEEFRHNFIVRSKLVAEQIYIDNDAPWIILRVAQPMEYLREFNQFGIGIKFGEMGQAHHWISSRDFARVVSRAHQGGFDPCQVLYPKGPEPYTFDRAMGTYLLNVHNRANMIKLPRQMLSVARKLFPRPHMQYYEAMMQLMNDVPEGAHRIKGHDEQVRGTTTLMQWCVQQTELRQ